MSRSSYAKALDKLLTPHGFRREGSEWIRTRGDMWECVDLQVSSVAGVTSNVAKKDLQTERILQNISCEKPFAPGQIVVRLGHLIDGYDRWWKNSSDGPAEMSAAVESYGLPWFDRVNTLEEQLAHWYGGGVAKPWRSSHPLERAVTLYRLGRPEEALALFDAPVPKTANPYTVTTGRCVQRWLKEQLERR